MLPNVDKVCQLPDTGDLYLPAAPTVDPPESENAPTQKPAKRAKTGKGNDAALTAAKICKLIGTVNPQTAQDAEYLWRRSEAARSAGLSGCAACVLIAAKISETETWCPDDLCEHKELEGHFEPEAFPAMEQEILRSVGWSIISCTASSSASLGEAH